MAEKTKNVAISVKRHKRPEAKIIQATGFRMRLDKGSGFVEIDVERRGRKGERVSFDPVILRSNLQGLKEYVASLPYDIDEQSIKEEVSVSDFDTYSNVIHICQVGGTAETIFSFFRFADWVEASRQESKSADREVFSDDGIVVISNPGLQKKLLLELISLLI
jgi:hypothetical protein